MKGKNAKKNQPIRYLSNNLTIIYLKQYTGILFNELLPFAWINNNEYLHVWYNNTDTIS